VRHWCNSYLKHQDPVATLLNSAKARNSGKRYRRNHPPGQIPSPPAAMPPGGCHAWRRATGKEHVYVPNATVSGHWQRSEKPWQSRIKERVEILKEADDGQKEDPSCNSGCGNLYLDSI